MMGKILGRKVTFPCLIYFLACNNTKRASHAYATKWKEVLTERFPIMRRMRATPSLGDVAWSTLQNLRNAAGGCHDLHHRPAASGHQSFDASLTYSIHCKIL